MFTLIMPIWILHLQSIVVKRLNQIKLPAFIQNAQISSEFYSNVVPYVKYFNQHKSTRIACRFIKSINYWLQFNHIDKYLLYNDSKHTLNESQLSTLRLQAITKFWLIFGFDFIWRLTSRTCIKCVNVYTVYALLQCVCARRMYAIPKRWFEVMFALGSRFFRLSRMSSLLFR